MKFLIRSTNLFNEKCIFRKRFYIFIIIFISVFFLLGYNLINYKGNFIVTLITYFKLIIIYSIISIIIRIIIKFIFYFDLKNTYLIFWKDNLHLSIANIKEIKKYKHIIVILSPIIFLIVIPLIIDFNSIYSICLVAVNLLFSSMDIYNFIKILFFRKDKFIFNGIDIVKENKISKVINLCDKRINKYMIYRNYKINISNKKQLRVLNKNKDLE